MKIDRSNYEIWFIDSLDGNLNDDQAEQLQLFLSENTDLKEELNDLPDIIIKPPVIDFTGKRAIRKAASDISEPQFEYLCAAYIENDLSEDELKELSEIISDDRKRQQSLELFKKLKLKPSGSVYENKKKLLKRTPVQKAIRMSFAGLSAAASAAILIISYFLFSGNHRDMKENLSHFMKNEGRAEHLPLARQTELPVPSKSLIFKDKHTETLPATDKKLIFAADHPETGDLIIEGSASIPSYMEMITPVEVPDISDAVHFVRSGILDYELIPLALSYPENSEEHWTLGKYLAKTFREKILREQTTDDSPLRGYEIAEAGVTGLNKLLGWQMALEKNNDENGEIKTVYFNSKLLKIHAPVNKTESTE